MGENPAPCLEEAFKQYETAAAANVAFKIAWRRQGCILARQVVELGRELAPELLTKAVELYELARGDYD